MIAESQAAIGCTCGNPSARGVMHRLNEACQATYAVVRGRMPRLLGVARDADSPGQKGVLLAFDRELTDDELRTLHDTLTHKYEQAVSHA